MAGISAMALYVPPYRVDLEQWCEWRGASWDKIRNVVGHSFRLCSPLQNVYTLAANSVIRLIQANEIDPQRIRFLGLGTESSTDNAAGAVIVKGLVNQALQHLGLPPLNRHCEVPEFKHACLGGVYAMKNALRFLLVDGKDSQAIAISADIAEYQAGSSGEPTQGAGAVAMLLEGEAQLAEINITASGCTSEYRGADFRKPFSRYLEQHPQQAKINDYPVFNGKYSTHCYNDAVLSALDDFYHRRQVSPAAYLDQVAAVFMHRPYHYMPRSSWGLSVLAALAHDNHPHHNHLLAWCQQFGVPAASVLTELHQRQPISSGDNGAYPHASALLKQIRAIPEFRDWTERKLQLGSGAMMQLGNLYTAALPAWLGFGLEQAARENQLESGDELLAIGYGSGDAAEALSLSLKPRWRTASRRLGFAGALENAQNLSLDDYQALHSGQMAPPGLQRPPGCVISRIGDGSNPDHNDKGIEYYEFDQSFT